MATHCPASTQELLDLVTSEIDESRILVAATHRPEYQPRSHGNVSGLTMNALKRRDAIEMARFVLRRRTISSEAIERIIDESDSIPLLVEELVLGAIDSDENNSPAQRTLLAVAFSAGGDGGRRSPELPTRPTRKKPRQRGRG